MNFNGPEPHILEQALRFFYARSWDAVQQPQEEALLFNIKLYVFGDAYLANELKAQAFKKCQSLLVDNINLEELADAVDLVFSNTKGTDQDLRAEILQFCANKPEILDIMQEHQHDSRPSKSVANDILLADESSSIATTTSSSSILVSTNKSPNKHPSKLQRRKANANKEAQRKQELLADLVARLEMEEPVAWHLQAQFVAASQKHAQHMQQSIDERATLEQKIRQLQADKDEAGRASLLLKSHTCCRNKACGVELTSYEYSKAGHVIAVRCQECNCKHSKIRE